MICLFLPLTNRGCYRIFFPLLTFLYFPIIVFAQWQGELVIDPNVSSENVHYNGGGRRIVRINNTVIALVNHDLDDHIYRSDDGGNSWDEIDTERGYSGCLLSGKDGYIYHFSRYGGHLRMVKFKYNVDPQDIPAPVNIAQDGGSIHGVYRQLNATVNRDGTIFLFYHDSNGGDYDSIYMFRSEDNGETWSDRILVRAGSSEHSWGFIRSDVTSSGKLVIVYSEWGSKSIQYAQSIDKGNTWQHTQIATADAYNPAILSGENNDIYVFAQSSALGGLVMKKSIDSGQTWTEEWQLIQSIQANNYANPSPALGQNGTIYVAFSNDFREYIAMSIDGGQTWSFPYNYFSGGRIGYPIMRYQTWHNYGGPLEWTWLEYVNGNYVIWYNKNTDINIKNITESQSIPVVSSVNGTISNGQAIRIIGQNFLDKNPAYPILTSYDNPDRENNWREGAIGGLWMERDDDGTGHLSNSFTRTDFYQSTYSFTYDASGGYNSIRYNYPYVKQEMYVSFWMYRDSSSLDLSGTNLNSKFFRLYFGEGIVANLVWSVVDNDNESVDISYSYGSGDYLGENLWNIEYTSPVCHAGIGNRHIWFVGSSGCKPVLRRWEHYEMLVRLPTNPGVPDASVVMLKDGASFARTANIQMGEESQEYSYMFPMFGQVSGSRNHSYNEYIDEVYIDTTPAHVYVSDSDNAVWPDIDHFNHTEIQVPSLWLNNSIEITFNQGSFDAGDIVYLYVVNSEGKCNLEGYPITIGQNYGQATDVNQDGQVNISDVQVVVNVILGNAANDRADVNGDERVTISDVQEVVNGVIN